MYLRKKVDLPTGQKILQEETVIQENTDSNVATELPKGIRGTRFSSWYHRRPYCNSTSHSLR